MSKDKKIVITAKRHEEVSWKRYITFEYEGNKYGVILEWDPFISYSLTWNNRQEPEWASEWIEADHEGMSLEHYLDELTYEMEDLS